MKHNILLVDDEANVLKSLKRLFVDTDYKIFTAESGERGLELCAKEEISLIMTDYRMPSMNGVQFLAKVKELYPRSIRIILSGYADVSAIVEAINDGQVYKFLSKPWHDQDLLTTVQRSLEHYDLQGENATLLDNLKTANFELQKLTESLELKVEDRTRDLALKNRALETAQRLLNLLPAGVIGIDSEGTLVYMNRAMNKHLDTSRLVLGEQIDSQLDSGPLSLLRKALEENRVACNLDETCGGMHIICSPLPDRAGVVGLFSFEDLNRYTQESVDQNTKVEAADVN